MKNKPANPGLGRVLRRLALYGFIGLFSLYVLGVTAGYSFLRFVRKNDQVRIVDVALFRIGAVRRAIAAQQFARAQAEWDTKKYQAAFLSFSFAVRQDPDNIPGRLKAAEFLRAVGADKLAMVLLEEGLTRAPADPRLIVPSFDLSIGSGLDRHALEVMQRLYGAQPSGPNGPMLQSYKILATLNAEGGEAAKKLVVQFPDLGGYAPSAPVVARVYRETGERLKAVDILAKYIAGHPAKMEDYALLAAWQEADGKPGDGVLTARHACAKFPQAIPARVLLLEMLAADSPNQFPAKAEVESFLRDFASRPEALTHLALLGGRKGWDGLTRSLYDLGAMRQEDLGLLALYHGDSLIRRARYSEAQRVLAQIDAQAIQASPAFMIQLRHRQVVVAAALRQTEEVREFARRLAALIRGEPDSLARSIRFFQKMGLAEAVAELSPRPAPPKVTARK